MAVDPKKIRERGVYYELHERIDRQEETIEVQSKTISALVGALLDVEWAGEFQVDAALTLAGLDTPEKRDAERERRAKR
jgi:hypothetical protein